MPQLEKKLELELEDNARVIACRFPFPHWTPDQVTGEGIDTVWAYDMSTFRGRETRPWRSMRFQLVIQIKLYYYFLYINFIESVCWSVGGLWFYRDLQRCLQHTVYFSLVWNEKLLLLSVTFGGNKQKLRTAGRFKIPFCYNLKKEWLPFHALRCMKTWISDGHVDGWEKCQQLFTL